MKRINVVIATLLLALTVTGCGEDIESAYLILNGDKVSVNSVISGGVVLQQEELSVVTPAPQTEDDGVGQDIEEVEPTPEPTPVPGIVEVVDIDVLEYFDNTLFIGDSRTAGLRQFGYFETADFFATPGLSVYSIPQTKVTVEGYEDIKLEELLAEKEYDRIYVMLGMNELGYRFSQTVERYRTFIEDLQDWEPRAQLILCANLHVTSTRSNNDEFFNNANIDKMNEEIRVLAEEKELVYLDINELFDNEDGELGKEYASDDSHVTVENYIRWCDWIVEKMNELENAAINVQ